MMVNFIDANKIFKIIYTFKKPTSSDINAPTWTITNWQRNLNQTVSDKLGAVHTCT